MSKRTFYICIYIYDILHMPYKFDKALRVLLLYMEVIGTYSSIYCEIDN